MCILCGSVVKCLPWKTACADWRRYWLQYACPLEYCVLKMNASYFSVILCDQDRSLSVLFNCLVLVNSAIKINTQITHWPSFDGGKIRQQMERTGHTPSRDMPRLKKWVAKNVYLYTLRGLAQGFCLSFSYAIHVRSHPFSLGTCSQQTKTELDLLPNVGELNVQSTIRTVLLLVTAEFGCINDKPE